MIKSNTFYSRIMGIGDIQRQSIVSFIWQIGITFIGFLSTIYFAHEVGASVLGAYFLFFSYYSLINLITDGGFGSAAIKKISEGEDQDAYFSAFFVLRSIAVTVVVVTLIVIREYFVDINNSGLFIWLLLALLISTFSGAMAGGVAGQGKIGIRATCNFINEISRFLIQIAAIYFGFNIAGLAGGFVLAMLISGIIEFHFFNLHFVRFNLGHIKSLSTFSFWIFLISGGMLIFMNLDVIMIGHYLDNADVGVYRVIAQFTGIAALTISSLNGTLWPKVSRWGKIGDTENIEKSLSRAFTYSLILVVPIFSGGILLGNKLLYFLYGAEFSQSYFTLLIMLTVQIVNIFYIFLNAYLSAMGKLRDLFKIIAAAVIANIVMNAILIPRIGISGAAIATFVTITVNVILAHRILSKTIKIRLEQDSVLNIIKASGIMVLFVGVYYYFIPLSNLWLTLIPVFLGGIIYSFSILKFDRKIYEELKGIISQFN